MYLNKRHYVKNWEHNTKKYSFLIKLDEEKVKEINEKRISYITEDVMYWRKANAIHNWFVQNVQGGEDNCREYYVAREDLEKLLDVCTKVVLASKLIKGKIKNGQTSKDGKLVDNMVDGEYIEDATVARELLPSAEGFFFGSAEYDQYYLRDIVETKKFLEEELRDTNSRADYHYNSSW